ncbi:MAG TPA: MaoC/PaaZ C-terminal domain-containing protein [Planctomycetaceae bacterium]|nr:MaoC/PaaZ C-terminal domain-containing protein [Planctomycetaceae bacterium]
MPHSFSLEDQELFARLSGDYNPLHIDPVAARRLMFGRPVVHGIHVLLLALDRWLESETQRVRLKNLTARFRAPAHLNEPIEFAAIPETSDAVKIVVTANKVKLLIVTLSYQKQRESNRTIPCEVPVRGSCQDRSAAELITLGGRLQLCLERSIASRLFPHVLEQLPPEQVGALLAMSRLVGMEAPGLHSIFAGLDLKGSDEERDPVLIYRSESYDDRLSLLNLRVAAPGFSGLLSAMLRPAPKEQATIAAIRAIVRPDEFRGERALVVGGSRGLGEVAVKGLVAGGAQVKFTFHVGAADAERIVSEIVADHGAVECFAYDVLSNAADLQSHVEAWSPTLLCYFATPFIFSAIKGRFSPNRFLDFCDYYVRGLHNTFQATRRLGSELRYVLCPSSSAIDELPLRLGEYAAAKSAGETLCRFLEQAHPGIRIHCPRWPRLATDQTASLLAIDTQDPPETVLRALREMRAAAGAHTQG